MSLSNNHFLPRLKIHQDTGTVFNNVPYSDLSSTLTKATSPNWISYGSNSPTLVHKIIRDIALLLEDIEETEQVLPSILIILSSVEETLVNEDSVESACAQKTLGISEASLEHQVEAIFLKALSELYDEDVTQSIRLLDEVMLYGIRSPRLASIYQVIFSMLSTNYNESPTDEILHPPASSFVPQISFKRGNLNSPSSPGGDTLSYITPTLTSDPPLESEIELPEKSKFIPKSKVRGKVCQNKRFTCSQCEKSFDRPSALASHRKTHSPHREFVCTLCSSAFKFKHDMERHIRRHTGEKPYPCCHCEQGFYRSDTMTNHMKTKHPNVKTSPSES